MNFMQRELMLARVRQIADEWAVPFVDPAFRGNVEAAQSLACGLSNEKRGLVAIAMWRVKAPADAFRAYLKEIWLHDHDQLVIYAGRQRLHAMFRYAGLPRPEQPEPMQVWRGTRGTTLRQAKEGFSWTTSRDVACWFAMRFASAERRPIVVSAEVPCSSVAWATDDSGESEVLLLRRVQHARIDGTPEDWQAAADRHQAAIMRMNDEAFPEPRSGPKAIA